MNLIYYISIKYRLFLTVWSIKKRLFICTSVIKKSFNFFYTNSNIIYYRLTAKKNMIMIKLEKYRKSLDQRKLS